MKIKKALECLEKNSEMFDEIALENKTSYKDGTVIEAYLFHFNQNDIKQALQQAEKEHNALEIIKEKNVDMFELKCCSSAKAYNNCISFKIGFIKNYELTEEEFNLLKEVLKDD